MKISVSKVRLQTALPLSTEFSIDLAIPTCLYIPKRFKHFFPDAFLPQYFLMKAFVFEKSIILIKMEHPVGINNLSVSVDTERNSYSDLIPG